MQIMNLSKLLKRIWWLVSAYGTMENLPDAVLFVNGEGVIEYYNKRAKEIFCFVDNSFGKYKISDVVKNAHETIEKSLTEQKPVLATTTLSELEFYVEINVQQKIGGYCIIARDLTSLTQEIANEEKVAKFNNEKNAMLAKLSDDLKSPLSSMIGFSQGLLDGLGGDLTEKQDKYIKIINSNAKDLYIFLDQLLTFSQAESTIYQENYHTFDVIELLKSSAKEFKAACEEKGITFDINCDELTNRNIYTDSEALKNAYQNILEVATSMTEKGFIAIKASEPKEEIQEEYKLPEGKRFLYLELRDTGSGVSEEDLKYLCEPYAQLDKGKKNILRSLKLGIASILIKRANGIINIRSELKKGTKYEILLPVEKGADE